MNPIQGIPQRVGMLLNPARHQIEQRTNNAASELLSKAGIDRLITSTSKHPTGRIADRLLADMDKIASNATLPIALPAKRAEITRDKDYAVELLTGFVNKAEDAGPLSAKVYQIMKQSESVEFAHAMGRRYLEHAVRYEPSVEKQLRADYALAKTEPKDHLFGFNQTKLEKSLYKLYQIIHNFEVGSR